MTLRIAISGSGNRSRTVWQRHACAHADVDLVGVQDPAPASLEAALAAGTITREQCFTNFDEMLLATKPDAVIVCNIVEAHAVTARAALEAGCHVLVEKPFTQRIADAILLTEFAETKGLVLGVVQNWRTKDVGRTLHDAIGRGLVGDVSHVFFRYLRDREAPTLPEYLFHEPDPLLFAVAVHHFDLFRYVLGQEIVEVEGRSFRPRWSRYEHPSGMHLWMETDGGVVISYVGTFSSRNGHLPIESLRVEGEAGTLANDSQYSEPPLWLSRRGDPEMVDLTATVVARGVSEQYDCGDTEILGNFVEAVTKDTPLVCPARDNLGTIAAVEAARRAISEGRAIDPRRLLAEPREGRDA